MSVCLPVRLIPLVLCCILLPTVTHIAKQCNVRHLLSHSPLRAPAWRRRRRRRHCYGCPSLVSSNSKSNRVAQHWTACDCAFEPNRVCVCAFERAEQDNEYARREDCLSVRPSVCVRFSCAHASTSERASQQQQASKQADSEKQATKVGKLFVLYIYLTNCNIAFRYIIFYYCIISYITQQHYYHY